MDTVPPDATYSRVMLYRVVHAVNASYALTVAWLYIACFAMALLLLFVFPQVTLLLFFLGLASLGITVLMGWALNAITCSLARQALSQGRCPRCLKGSQRRIEHDQPFVCDYCGAEFLIGGGEVDQVDRRRFHDEQELRDDQPKLLEPIFTEEDERAWFARDSRRA